MKALFINFNNNIHLRSFLQTEDIIPVYTNKINKKIIKKEKMV